MNKNIDILIADDHQLLIDGLYNFLIKLSYINKIATAKNGKHVLELIEKKKTDIVIADYSMPVMNGLELSRVLIKNFPKIKIIILTSWTSEEIIKTLGRAGVQSILIKTATYDIIEAAIKAVMNNQNYYCPDTQNILKNIALNIKSTNPNKIELSQREKNTLKLVCDGLTDKEIADKMFCSIKSIEYYKRNLRAKFEVTNEKELIVKAIKSGFYDVTFE